MSKVFSKYKAGLLADETGNEFVKAGVELTKQYAELKGKTNSEYAENNGKFMDSLMKYCVTKAGFNYNGIESLNNAQITNDMMFQKTFNVIVAQIIAPVAPAVVSETYSELAEVRQIGWGDTARFVVKSNDLFFVSDVAEGVQLGGLQRLYNNEVTVNPVPKQIRFNMEWYQVASGVFDFGEWSYKIGASFAGYIQKLIINSLTTVITDGLAAASPYFVSGYSDANYISRVQKVKAANGNAEVYAMGTLTVLGKVIPSTVGLQYGLGEEISKKGYLDMYKGARLMEIEQAMLPTTINTTATLMIPDDVLYFIAMGQYRPIKVVFEGENVVVETLPNVSADKTMGMAITMRLGISSVVGSKFGAITDIV